MTGNYIMYQCTVRNFSPYSNFGAQKKKFRNFTHLGIWVQATLGKCLSSVPSVDKSFAVGTLLWIK